jgi:RNA polymerase sigma factor (sigma-70 family)
MKPRNHKQNKEYAFNSYCKRILKQYAIDLQRKAARLGEREIAFSALSARELAELATTDEYFTDAYVFDVLGESVGVTDSDLAEALNAIPADRREIVLLSYFFDMNDREIAERLNMARRTVADKRQKTLNELKKIMEESEE